MAKPEHTRVTFEGITGQIATPVEHWAIGVNFPADALPIDGNQIVDDLVAANAAGAWYNNLRLKMPSDVWCLKVKVARIGADGHMRRRADGSYVQGLTDVTQPGTQAQQGIPLQTALVASLKTLRPGPTGKGRIFLPFPAKPIDVNAKTISFGDAQDIANTTKAFLNALAGVMTFAPQVVSSKGYMTPVTGVRVGRVPDTMRSRRSDVIEGYAEVPLA
jgi:hypothetical protein